jgi:hypothetical protein
MTVIRDRRGWLSKLRGVFSRGPATTAERMARVKAELDEQLALRQAQDEGEPEQRFRHSQGAVSPEGKAALEKGRSPAFQRHIARLIGGGDG